MRQRSPGTDAELSLAWLLEPLSVENFLDEIWAKDHHHVKHGCSTYFADLIPGPSLVDQLLQMFRGEPSAVRLVKGSDKRGADRYLLADGSLDLAAVRRDFADGYTIVLDGVDQYARPVGTLARSLEVELHFPVQVNTYVTPPGQIGLAAHYDDHDVLILQIQGSKIWHLYVDADMPPREIQRETEKAVDVSDLPPPTDIRLQAGDVLYVPRGRVHSAETTAEQSVHLTVGIHAPTVLMLAIGALYSRSFLDDQLNARVPPRHLDNAGPDPAIVDLVRAAVSTVEDPDAVADGLGLLSDALVRRGLCPPVGKISDAKEIDRDTRVAKFQPLYSHVKNTDDGVTLEFASLSINAGCDHEAAMRFISTSTGPFRVDDLPALNAKQQTDLIRTLIVSGFLIRLPDGKADGRDG